MIETTKLRDAERKLHKVLDLYDRMKFGEDNEASRNLSRVLEAWSHERRIGALEMSAYLIQERKG